MTIEEIKELAKRDAEKLKGTKSPYSRNPLDDVWDDEDDDDED